MSPERDSARTEPLETSESRENLLNQEPEKEIYGSRDLDEIEQNEDRKQGYDPRIRKRNEVGSENGGHRAAGADRRNEGIVREESGVSALRGQVDLATREG